MVSAFSFLSSLLAAGFLGYLVATTGLLRLLRTRHEQTWFALGRPSLFCQNTVSNGFAILRFLWRKDYLELDDPQLTRLCTFLLVYQVAYLTLLVALLFFAPHR